MSKVIRLRPDVAVPLNNSTLPLHSKSLAVPTYDRSALTPAIVHLGVGGFHRAHQAAYLDDVANKGLSLDWGVTGVGLHRREMKEVLSAQDCLYSMVERSAEGEKVRVIGSLSRYLYAREEAQQVIAALSDERTRIVSLTITGDGYCLCPDSALFDEQSPAVRADLSSSGPFTTAWAYLTAALEQRRRAGTPPFTVMSCDNMPDNGKAARTALVSFAGLRDTGLAHWIDDNVAFPSTMVDRITPKTTPNDRNVVERTYRVADRWPVITESFSQWVIEDDFCNGRPPLEEVGVELVDDVAGHKTVKSRLLNGTHCALGYVGLLAGYQWSHEAMQDPVIYRYIERMMREEMTPLLPAVPGLDVEQYRETVLQRLLNPRIGDQLSRLAARGSTKIPAYLLPSVIDARARSRPHALLSMAVAAWIRYLRGDDLVGRPHAVEDPRAPQLTTIAKVARNDARLLVRTPDLFGALGQDDEWAQCLSDGLYDLNTRGIHGALRRVLSDAPENAAAG